MGCLMSKSGVKASAELEKEKAGPGSVPTSSAPSKAGAAPPVPGGKEAGAGAEAAGAAETGSKPQDPSVAPATLGEGEAARPEAAASPVAASAEKVAPKEAHVAVGELKAARALTAEEVAEATGGFPLENYMGAGGCGDAFRGQLSDGSPVVVKRVISQSQLEEDFMEEVDYMSKLLHKHVVRLVGYCQQERERALVFERASMGTLHEMLHGFKDGRPAPDFPWQQRLAVLLQAAQGLSYIHNEAEVNGTKGVVHKRVKSSNVFVFSNFLGKVGDSRLQPPDQDSLLPMSSMPLGNFACEPPELFLRASYTAKGDVFAFGIVILEAFTGRKPTHPIVNSEKEGRHQQQSLKEWFFDCHKKGTATQCVDPRLANELSEKTVDKLCKLVTLCLEHEPLSRPDIRTVIKAFEKLSS